ncbi:YheC/YheD family protein [Bacillus sp. WMMC1349]|uniref:YheC/YheD family endospore coat-associated protein n=1 Tax=Bacillus sp. WMMC1349 TaxID=2736254 RepID=UPI001553B6AC|nr:YheC/YheD family protein [Bacillus sp. WMMC1349]NPC92056.1 YheC/YheD family protein [Bacillus sp. WMMC1349]
MIDERFAVGIHQNSKNKMVLPSILKQDGFLYVAFGTNVERCHISFDSDLQHTILLSENLYRALRIPYRGKAALVFHDKTIYIGPLIGIFTAGFTKSEVEPVKGRSLFFAKLLMMDLPLGGFCYLFGAHHIQWEDGSVKGLIFRKNSWEQITVPLPNVVYDRLPNRQAENADFLQKTKIRLINEYQIPWFNPRFFNKWELYQALQQNDSTACLLPYSVLEPSAKTIETMIDQYQMIYLKPVDGSLGQGIVQLSKQTTNKIVAKSKEGQHIFSSATAFLDQYKQMDYLAQQGIERMRVDGQPADFRVHTNKNRNGNWTVTAIAVKIAKTGGCTTHMSSGGIVKTLSQINCHPQERLLILQKLTKTALLISRVLDQKITGLIGEIGIDLGIDLAGHVWMFEANSRPGRGIFTHPSLTSVSRLTNRRNFEYASYLTEQAIQYPEKMWQSEIHL